MDSANYELDLPRENIHIRCFAHNIMNYRYHWHVDDYELSILLHGVQSYCRGSENSLLHEDDVILTAPGNGHASMTQAADTCALVLHFSAAAFKPLVKKGVVYQFPSCRSTDADRSEPRYRVIRFYASQLFRIYSRAGHTPSLRPKPPSSCSPSISAPSSSQKTSTPCRRILSGAPSPGGCWSMWRNTIPPS